MAPNNEHLQRLEEKVDKIAEAVSKLVLLEFQQQSIGQNVTKNADRITTLEAETRRVEAKLDRWINRGLGAWGVVVLAWSVATFILKHS